MFKIKYLRIEWKIRFVIKNKELNKFLLIYKIKIKKFISYSHFWFIEINITCITHSWKIYKILNLKDISKELKIGELIHIYFLNKSAQLISNARAFRG